MYDDELFECILTPKAGSISGPLVYKYFSEVDPKLQDEYFSEMREMNAPSDRRTLLGSSITTMQAWTQGGEKV
jgi:hypothetical protein